MLSIMNDFISPHLLGGYQKLEEYILQKLSSRSFPQYIRENMALPITGKLISYCAILTWGECVHRCV